MADKPNPKDSRSQDPASRHSHPPEGPASDPADTRYPGQPVDSKATRYPPTPAATKPGTLGLTLPCRFGDYELLERLG
jgi:hypothetical protein